MAPTAPLVLTYSPLKQKAHSTAGISKIICKVKDKDLNSSYILTTSLVTELNDELFWRIQNEND